jgi:hypothetical protein
MGPRLTESFAGRVLSLGRMAVDGFFPVTIVGRSVRTIQGFKGNQEGELRSNRSRDLATPCLHLTPLRSEADAQTVRRSLHE